MPHLTAFTRAVSPAFAQCELTHQPRVAIDVDRARAQHAAYEQALADAGCTVYQLPAANDLPDSVFIEDTAIVLDEVVVITRPGAPSRRPEVTAVAEALKSRRLLTYIEEPATIDGGDVLVIGRTIYVGRTGRTNSAAIEQLQALMQHFGYDVHPVAVNGCLHLKSAATLVSDDTVLVNPAWIPADAFAACTRVAVDPSEPYAANVLRVGNRVIAAAAFPRTRERLEQRGIVVSAVDVSEIAKAEGAVTCCSLIMKDGER